MTSPFGAPAQAAPAAGFSAPAAAPAGLPADLSTLFGAPAQPPRKGTGPKIRDLYVRDPATGLFRGALILYRVQAFEKNRPGVEAGKVQDRATVDIAVLDGGPYPWGGDPAKQIPHPEVWDVANPPEPGWIKASYVSSAALCPVFEVVYLDKLAGRGTGIGLGRLGRDPATKPGQNDTFLISTNLFDNDGKLIRPAYTAEDAETASNWLRRFPAFVQ